MAKKKAPEPDASTPLYSVDQMAEVAKVAFDIGMKVVQAMDGHDAVFVTREIDPANGDVVYAFEHYDRYLLVKDES